MARYKPVETNGVLMPVMLGEQLVPGTFEFALNHLVDTSLDLSALDAWFKNDVTGASAYDPRVMLKIVLLGYSQGLMSSRAIARACQLNVQFMAISGDSQPSFTHIAKFVRSLATQIKPLFHQVLMVCDEQGLIGKQMFAIDGVKLPSNASKERSGTHAELVHRAERLEKAAGKILARHQEQDESKEQEPLAQRAQVQRERLESEARRMREFIATNAKRLNKKGKELKSNVTDPDSAKMATSKGVIQGYAAQAAVDSKHQVIVAADVLGSGAEQAALLSMIEQTNPVRQESTLITADAGYHSKANVQALQAQNIPAMIADGQMRKRDERFAQQGKHKSKDGKKIEVLHDKRAGAAASKPRTTYKASQFSYDQEQHRLVCPMGKVMNSSGKGGVRGYIYLHFKGTVRDCVPCPNRDKCIAKPNKARIKHVYVPLAKLEPAPVKDALGLMRQAIDSSRGRQLYSQRLGTVEPVFAHLRHNKGLTRLNLRGKAKVNTQWNLYCMVHNIGKLASVTLKTAQPMRA